MTNTHRDHAGDPDLIEYRELEPQVLPTYWKSVLDWVAEAASGIQPRRIVDLGAGTGVAALSLAERFRDAEVIAVDVSRDALAMVRKKAGKALVADRVATLEADLDAVWPPDLVALDLTWASMSLHHLADPDQALRAIFRATRRGGLVAVAEAGEPLRLLPDELGGGRPGLEARCLDAEAAAHRDTLPSLGTDWAQRLRGAGFDVLDECVFPLEEDPAVLPETARYAQLRLQRFRAGLADDLAKDDLEALDALLDESAAEFVGRRTDFTVEGSRVVTLARRP